MPGKIPIAIDEIKKIVDAKKKVVVWCTRVKTIDRMYEELKNQGYDSLTVTGRIPQDGEVDPNDSKCRVCDPNRNTNLFLIRNGKLI